jgi:hypothetical protein
MQRKLYYHQLNNPMTKPQCEYSMESKSNKLGSYKNIDLETIKLLNIYR